jgi:hypothetical protein
MADKFLVREGGRTKQKAPVAISAGAADAGKLLALNSAGKVDETALPAGIGLSVLLATATEALSAGVFVNLYGDGGVLSARLADNSNGRVAKGFVLDAVADAAEATVYHLDEVNSGLSGLAPGDDYWLGTAGGVIAVPLDEADDGNAGKISQHLGTAISATELATTDSDPVIL